MTGEVTQVKLAQERTHAAWIRTCLTFLVTAVAFRHYEDGQWVTISVLSVGAVIAALRATTLAPDVSTRLMAFALAGVSVATAFI